MNIILNIINLEYEKLESRLDAYVFALVTWSKCYLDLLFVKSGFRIRVCSFGL